MRAAYSVVKGATAGSAASWGFFIGKDSSFLRFSGGDSGNSSKSTISVITFTHCLMEGVAEAGLFRLLDFLSIVIDLIVFRLDNYIEFSTALF